MARVTARKRPVPSHICKPRVAPEGARKALLRVYLKKRLRKGITAKMWRLRASLRVRSHGNLKSASSTQKTPR